MSVNEQKKCFPYFTVKPQNIIILVRKFLLIYHSLESHTVQKIN